MEHEPIIESGFTSISDGKSISVVNLDFNLAFPLNREDIDILSEADYKRFIHDIESMIRSSEEYTMYKAHFYEDLKLNQCMIHSDITSEMAPIEMHHGPIFNLFEIVELEIMRRFITDEPINSPEIFDSVMQLHWDEQIQVVALCVSCHKACHPKKKGVKPLFIDIRSAHGDVVGFINKYKDCFAPKHIRNIQKYQLLFDEYANDTAKSKISEARRSNMKVFTEVVTKWEESCL